MALSSNKGKLARDKINGAVAIQLSVDVTNVQVVLHSWNVSNMHLDINGATAEKLPFGQIMSFIKKNARHSTENNAVFLKVLY